MEHRYRIGADIHTLRPDRSGGMLRVHVDEGAVEIDDCRIDERYVTIRRGERTERYLYARAGRHIHIALAGASFELVPAEEEAEDAGAGGGFTPEVVAPMPGKVLEVLVDCGDRVQAGAPLLVLEAMKMEQTIRASAPALVRSISVEAGAMVGPGQALVVLEAVPDETGPDAEDQR
jgi:biotin carboxyl carrier protein